MLSAQQRLARLHLRDSLLLLGLASLCVFLLVRVWTIGDELRSTQLRAGELIRLTEQALLVNAKAAAAHQTETAWIYVLMDPASQSDRLGAAADAFSLAQGEFSGAVNGLAAQVSSDEWTGVLITKLRSEHGAFVRLHRSIYERIQSAPDRDLTQLRAVLASDGLRLSESVSALTQTLAYNFSREAQHNQDVLTKRIAALRLRLLGFVSLALILVALLGALGHRAWRATSREMEALRLKSHTDALTQLPNRRSLDLRIREETARARREGTALTVAVIDLDHFKAYNDLHGHDRGDQLLRHAAAAWREHVRPTDFLARVGGEEFVLLMVDCDTTQAATLLERLRLVTPDHQTFSAGFAQLMPDETAPDWLRRADTALYAAKRSGRDRFEPAAP
jgi:diguanylate cyclase (GGDEF)-like protein